MKDIDKILGKSVHSVSFLTCQFDSNRIEIEKILINFGLDSLLLEIDQDSDKIIPRIINDFSFTVKEPEHKVFNVTEKVFKEYYSLLNTKLIWFWTLTNDQGYFDGIQLEFENHNTFQFIVESSYFRNSKLEQI